MMGAGWGSSSLEGKIRRVEWACSCFDAPGLRRNCIVRAMGGVGGVFSTAQVAVADAINALLSTPAPPAGRASPMGPQAGLSSQAEA